MEFSFLMINTREVKVVDGFHGNRNFMYFGFPVSQPRVLHSFWVHYFFRSGDHKLLLKYQLSGEIY